MSTVVHACIDGRADTAAIVDWAAWSARRLAAPLAFVHVLERPAQQHAALADYSGAIGLGAQDALLQQLGEADARRARLAQEAGRLLLAQAVGRAVAASLDADPEGLLRHGELVDAVLELEAGTRLFVLGEHHRPGGMSSRLHLDHHVERVVRSVRCPVLVVAGRARFEPPKRFMVAFDGSETSRRTVQAIAGSPLLAGLPALLATAGDDTLSMRHRLDEACATLTAAGFAVETEIVAGEPEAVLPSLARTRGAGLLAMGAYGHSRIRQLVVGSTTTALLRLSEMPVLVLR